MTGNDRRGGLITMRQVRQQYRLDHRTLSRLITDEGLATYRDPANRRVVLIDPEQLTRALTPRPIDTSTPTAPAPTTPTT